jgi:hypothetical protein
MADFSLHTGGIELHVHRVRADQLRRAMEIFGMAKRLWGIKPGPLVAPSWQAKLEAALTRHGARLP